MSIPTLAAPSLGVSEKQELRRLAHKATRLYPGPVGEIVARELITWEEFGHRLGNHAQMRALLRHLDQTEVPQP